MDTAVKMDDIPANAWICEKHPDQPWPHPNTQEPDGRCAGPGKLRPDFAAALDEMRRCEEASAAGDVRPTSADRRHLATRES